MSTLRDVKRHILGVRSTRKVTNAMKVVAATKLRRFETEYSHFQNFRDRIISSFEDLMSNMPPPEHPLLTLRSGSRKQGIFIVTSDRGLCGPFNHNLFKESLEIMEQEQKLYDLELFVLGIKGSKFFKNMGFKKIAFEERGIDAIGRSELAKILAEKGISGFMEGKFDRVLLVSYQYESRAKFYVAAKQLLPIPVGEREPKTKSNLLCNPSDDGVLNFLLPLIVRVRIEQALLHSFLSEEVSRMFAMEYATDNADRMIEDLTLQYHRVRQSLITREVSEIVGGAEALKQSG